MSLGMIRIYLDNCCFNRPFDNQIQEKIQLETEAKLFIQKKIKSSEFELVWSFILDFENSANPDLEAKDSIQFWKKLTNIKIISNKELTNLAKNFQQIGFGIKDSLHIASAIQGSAKYFITVDKGILKKKDLVKEIKILSPISFIEIGEEL